MALKSPRFIKPYPKRKVTLIRRRKRGAVKWEYLRQPRPRRHAQAPRGVRTSYDVQATLEARAAQNIRGSLQERIFYKALIDRHFIPELDFTFQPSFMGGRAELGGLIADFMFPLPMVIVQVQSVWHTMSLANERRDDDQFAILRSMGYTVLEIWPFDIEDPGALDLWMSRNVMTLWGTSSSGGFLGASSITYTTSIEDTMLNEINLTLDAIIRVLEI